MIRPLTILLFLVACGDEDKKKPEPKPTQPPTEEPGQKQPETGPGWPIPIPPGFPFPWPPDLPFPPGIPVPPQEPTPPEQPSEPSGDSEVRLLNEINKIRAERGLGAVVATDGLNCAAQRHAKDVGSKGICGHTGSDGSSPWDRARDCGAQADGEIVACGQGSPADAVRAWSMSPGHAAIMFDRSQQKVGVAMHNNYWVAIFL